MNVGLVSASTADRLHHHDRGRGGPYFKADLPRSGE
jgi:hypothetical protein